MGGGEQMLVPRVIGQTAEARQKKTPSAPRSSRQWDEQSFLEEIENRAGSMEAEVAGKIIHWSRGAFSRLTWGKGAIDGGFSPALDHDGRSYWPFYLWTHGKIEIQFYWMEGWPPFDQPNKRLEFLTLLNAIPGVDIPESSISKRPNVPLSAFAEPVLLSQLLGAMEWFLAEARSASTTRPA